MNDGDWAEGKPQWWWKYVFPSREQLWLAVLHDRIDRGVQVSRPSPEPWREQTAVILEGVAMLQATTMIDNAEVSKRLTQEAVAKIIRAAEQVRG